MKGFRTAWLALSVMIAAVLAIPGASAETVTDLDETFGTDGVALSELPDGDGGTPLPVVDDSGGIFVVDSAGHPESAVVVYRLDASGALDTSFGTDGRVIIDHWTYSEYINAAILDSQGRLVMAGQAYTGSGDWWWLVVRLNPDGTLDQSFGSGGIAEFLPNPPHAGSYDSVTSVDIDSAGRILVGGICCTYNLATARLTESGTLDSTFGENGVMVHPHDGGLSGGQIVVDSADRVLGAMSVTTRTEDSPWGPISFEGTALFRLTQNGEIDTTYGTDGLTIVEITGSDSIDGLAIDGENRLLVLEDVDYSVHLARFLADGEADASYGDDGVFTLTSDELGEDDSIWAGDVVVYPGNRAVVIGEWYTPDYPVAETDLLVLRVTEDGTLDSTFSGEGVARLDPLGGEGGSDLQRGGLVVDSEDKIVVAFSAIYWPDKVDDFNNWTGYLGVARYLATSDGPIQPIGDLPPSDDPPPPDDGSDGGTFIDDDGHTFEADIEWLAGEGITKGCNPPSNDRFCPDDLVTRGQMAAFLHRALDDVLTPTQSVEFIDDDANTFEADIEWLGGTGVTKGCNPPTNNRYCPSDFVTRGQMAAFLVRALGYSDDGGGDLFIDDDGSTFEHDIDRLGTAGVTKGCNPPVNDQFCPTDLVTRGQMAAFLHRALGS